MPESRTEKMEDVAALYFHVIGRHRGKMKIPWIPACAGKTIKGNYQA